MANRFTLALACCTLACASADVPAPEHTSGVDGNGGVEAASVPVDAAAAAPDAARDMSPAATSPAAAPVDAARSSGCGSMATPPNGPQTITVNGKSRGYVI